MTGEKIEGVVVFLLGVLMYFVLIPVGIDSPSNLDHITLSPNFWPSIISAIFGLMGLLMIIMPDKKKDEVNLELAEAAEIINLPYYFYRLTVVLIALFCFYFLIDSLGMVVPGIVVIFSMMLFAGEKRIAFAIFISVLVPILLYVFFVHIASIPIPLGIFESLVY
jgi:putative tricarboxylic transport membrane protein